jgi:hypothetical protein
VPFPVWLPERRVVLEQTSGEGCSDERPMTLTESGRFRFVSGISNPDLANPYHYHFFTLLALASASSLPTRPLLVLVPER